MARTDQYVGLSERAKEFLDRNAKKDVFHLYKNGEIADRWEEPQKKVYDTIWQMCVIINVEGRCSI